MAKLESDFQANLIKEIKILFPGCYVLKTDPRYIQGIPDLLILWREHWALLECKRKKPEKRDYQPNQQYHIRELNKMSFSKVIFPENKEDVLRELQQSFGVTRSACVFRRKQISLD